MQPRTDKCGISQYNDHIDEQLLERIIATQAVKYFHVFH
ncbi:hypothetical Protein YC6258_04738 [Gynuella sunshinyii YC6258]|uniref:Uncharacterized protein n=1 Tax=Gynuella sunshinyii YC6258 TaxID=1445510 RepID=A0A0C5VBS7_9GAMM|nr:hypothetical Protein YC6258_04738 [Gynuella sunshinyii YC6258]